VTLSFGIAGCSEIKADLNEVFDYRCKDNGIVYTKSDYLKAAIDSYLMLTTSKDYFKTQEKIGNDNYNIQNNPIKYRSSNEFYSAFPDCCRADVNPYDNDIDNREMIANLYILYKRRNEKLVACVTIKQKFNGSTSEGKTRQFERTHEYEVGNYLEVKEAEWQRADWLVWPNNTLLQYFWFEIENR
jgi:hypothetical protein